jgi:hydroxymethylpyrimidine/phosphomethylpyrimidine kinase
MQPARITPDILTGRILFIAGSDSSGGAGIQADLKTATCFHGYGMTAITALTAQNTRGVHEVYPVPAPFVQHQIEAVLSDIGVDAVKTGMLHDASMIAAVVESLAPLPGIPLVVDPVMIAKGGHRLLHEDALDALRTRLLPLATIITPNLPEAAALAKTAVPVTLQERLDVVEILLERGCRAILLKGGHASDDVVTDLFATQETAETLTAPRLSTPHTHGTGCTLAAAIATRLGQGADLRSAVHDAHAFTQHAMSSAPHFGHGHGPLGHLPFYRDFTLQDFGCN